MRILIIEDDKATAFSLRENLKSQYAVDVAYTGGEGEYQAYVNEYDLIIIDFNLPDMSGLDVCKSFRKNEVKTPILMLTGRTDVEDKVSALDAGADDYLTKPFSTQELQARIRALMRRKTPDNQLNAELTAGDLTLDLTTQTVRRGKKVISLRRKELQLLEFLMRNKGRTVTRNMIVEHIWDNSSDPLTNTVDVHIKYLRDRIDKGYSRKLIKTVYGMGYKIEG